jgi:septation ring formation regulator EzrA
MSLPAMRAVEAENANERSAGEDFPALEEKIYKAIELLKSAREGQAAAERDANRLRDQLEQREEELELVRAEVVSLRKEREEVRGRVEKMLKQIDTLVQQA